MNLQNMTKDQLLNYIVELHQEVDKLNVLENERKKAEENLEQLSRKNRYQEITRPQLRGSEHASPCLILSCYDATVSGSSCIRGERCAGYFRRFL